MNGLILFSALLVAAPAQAATAEDSALERLHSDDIAARVRACVELSSGAQRGARVYPALVSAMDRDLSERVRLAAAKAVVTFPDGDPIKRVQSFFQSEPGAQNRAALILALSTEPAHLDDGDATQLIASLLSDDPSPDVRHAAALGLTRRKDIQALPAVRLAAVNDADKSVRDAARQAVRVLSAPRPPPPKPKTWKAPAPKPDAVKGTDACPAPWSWCECDGPIKRPPKCMTRSDCRIEINTMIQLGMPCTWDGLPIGMPSDE